MKFLGGVGSGSLTKLLVFGGNPGHDLDHDLDPDHNPDLEIKSLGGDLCFPTPLVLKYFSHDNVWLLVTITFFLQ